MKIIAIVVLAAAVNIVPAHASGVTTYTVTGQVAPYCFTASEYCGNVNDPSEYDNTPILGGFTLNFDLGGAGYPNGVAVDYIGRADFTSAFTELVSLDPNPGFQIQATYPVPDLDGFPGFDTLESVEVSYNPPCAPAACPAGQVPNEAELTMTAALLNSSQAVMNLYFQNGNPAR